MKDKKHLADREVFIRIPLRVAKAILTFVEDNNKVEDAKRYEDFYNEIRDHYFL